MFKLNPAQLEAVRHLDSPLLVLAGAGSGKTRVITQKIAWLVEDYGVKPSQIAAITFTNKAAKEMKERVGKQIGGRAEGLIVSTFHALGVRILRQEAGKLGLKPGFSILDAADTTALLPGARRQCRQAAPARAAVAGLAVEEPAGRAGGRAGNRGRRHRIRRGDAVCRLRTHAARLPGGGFRRPDPPAGEALLRQRGSRRALAQPALACAGRRVPGHQPRPVPPAAPADQGRDSFTAVGDDDQSIYAWRGADSENLRLLRDDYPSLKVVKLEQNYRSTARILHAANALIANNPKLFDKQLWSEHGQGEAIHVQTCRDGEHEAEWVVSRLSAHRFERRTKFSDYAILYRGNHQARVIEQQLRAQRIPYVISGGQSFFDRAEVKDITSYLRLLSNQDDDPAFIRAVTTPKRGIGGTTLEALGRAAGRRHLSLFAAIQAPGLETELNVKQRTALREFGDFIKRMEARAAKEPAGKVLNDMVRAIGYESWLFESLEPREAEGRWANVSDLVAWLEKKGIEENKNLLELAQSVALLSMLDKDEGAADAVQLATLHAAKGLEFRHVFLVGVEEGLLPHRDSLEPGKLEEERRLMYVGITRAQASLTVSHCEKRKQGRELMAREPSRFIAEMGAEVASAAQRRNTVPEPDAARAKASALRAMLAGKR
jgi:ATP-dependent DNA helicase Rep